MTAGAYIHQPTTAEARTGKGYSLVSFRTADGFVMDIHTTPAAAEAVAAAFNTATALQRVAAE